VLRDDRDAIWIMDDEGKGLGFAVNLGSEGGDDPWFAFNLNDTPGEPFPFFGVFESADAACNALEAEAGA
jgi:hypothetical protein